MFENEMKWKKNEFCDDTSSIFESDIRFHEFLRFLTPLSTINHNSIISRYQILIIIDYFFSEFLRK